MSSYLELHHPHRRRHDGRHDTQARTSSISFPGLARVDGSAQFSFISAEVINPKSSAALGLRGPSALCSVSGPIDVRLSLENPSHATFEVLVRPLSHISGTESKALAATIRTLLTPSLMLSNNPRTLVQLVVQALVPIYGSRYHGGWTDPILAAMINASTLSLLNAGSLPMRGVVCAVAVGRRSDDDSLIVDPDEHEDDPRLLSASGCFAFLFASDIGIEGMSCVWTNWRSIRSGSAAAVPFDEKLSSDAQHLAQQAVRVIYEAMKKSIDAMLNPPDRSTFPAKIKTPESDDNKQKRDEVRAFSDADDDKMEI